MEITDYKDAYENLKVRFNNLAKEKAHLSTINLMYKKLNGIVGYKEVIKNLFEIIMDFYGGLDIKIYYILDNKWNIYDITHNFKEIEAIFDHLVLLSIEKKNYVYEELTEKTNSFIVQNSKNVYVNVRNYAFPMSDGEIVFAVIKIEKMLIHNNDLIQELSNFINYSAILLSNQLFNYKELKKSLDEKNILLAEIHHRVKNNLQLISSLINLQMMSINDEKVKNSLKELNLRIKSMGIIHEKLYQTSNFTTIDVEDYIITLINELKRSLISKEIDFCLEIDRANLNLDTIIPLGLLINEILTNSMKYAFKNLDKGKICIKLYKEGISYKLIISDNGCGISGDIDFENSKTLGFRLINALIMQINGKLSFYGTGGSEFTIIFNELTKGKNG